MTQKVLSTSQLGEVLGVAAQRIRTWQNRYPEDAPQPLTSHTRFTLWPAKATKEWERFIQKKGLKK